MEILYWIIAIPAFTGSFILAWTFFPKLISRSERYHKSEAEMLLMRVVQSFAFAVVVCMFLSTIGEHKKDDTSATDAGNAAEAVPTVPETPAQVDNTNNDDATTVTHVPDATVDKEQQSQTTIATAMASKLPAPISTPQTSTIDNAADTAVQQSQDPAQVSNNLASNAAPIYPPSNEPPPANAINPLNDTRPIH